MNHDCRCFRCHALLARTSTPVRVVAPDVLAHGIEIRCRRCKTAVVLDAAPRAGQTTSTPTPSTSTPMIG
jgi:hypothetical protein